MLKSPFSLLLDAIAQHIEDQPSRVVLESRSGAFTWADVGREWEVARSVFLAKALPRRAVVYGERDAAWLGSWLAALETRTPWLMVSDELAVGMCNLLERAWQPNLRLPVQGDDPLCSPPETEPGLVFATGSSRNLALKGCCLQDWQRRQAVWEQWLDQTPVGRVGWWLPAQHPDLAETALYHLRRGAVLSCALRETMGNRWLRSRSSSRPVLLPAGLTHLHLTALQAMNTRWSDASSQLKAWIHGPCPDWVLDLHPGLSRSPLPDPRHLLEIPALETQDEQLLETFQWGMAHRDPAAEVRQQIEEQVRCIEGVASCGWFLGPNDQRHLMAWVAPGYDRAWVGAQVQEKIRPLFDTRAWEWRFLDYEGVSTLPDGQQDLKDVMYWLFDTD